MSIFDWLPLFPWEGLPLPRFLNIYWPWAGQQQQSPQLPALRQYVSDVKEEPSIVPYQAPLASYQNEESWEIEWSEDGLPLKIVVTRHATRG